MAVPQVRSEAVAASNRRGAIATAGFTIVELLVTLALVGVAATVILPLASVMEQRAKEAELRLALRTIRTALDSYKAAVDGGVVARGTGLSGFPSSLAVLADGVPRADTFGNGGLPLVFLRQVPRDPFSEDVSLPAEQTWTIRSYGTKVGDPTPGPDVFDISSKSSRLALDGTRLSDW